MTHSGNIRKMKTKLQTPVAYKLPIGDAQVDINALLGKHIKLSFNGDIHCIACGRKTKKSFNQGYCYPCMQRLAECDICIVRPEQCHFEAGTCRDEAWAQEHCMQDHFVYLANSSGIKVGITRQSQIPTRWMDQGASQALPIFRVKNRYISGLLEVILKNHVSDRTDWRKMLKQDPEPIDLVARAEEIIAESQKQIDKLIKQKGEDAVTRLFETPLDIHYPVQQYPAKVSSFNFDKTAEVEGELQGIKGQYLILSGGVLNMRKFAGYHLSLQV